MSMGAQQRCSVGPAERGGFEFNAAGLLGLLAAVYGGRFRANVQPGFLIAATRRFCRARVGRRG